MAEQEEEEVDENKRIRPREQARGQKDMLVQVFLDFLGFDFRNF